MVKARKPLSITAILGCAVLAIALLAVGYYTLRLIFTEDLESKRWSYSYLVTITSNTIRQFPVIKPIESPTFASSPGDGPALPYQSIKYDSHVNPDSLMPILVNYLEQKGYRKTQEKGFMTGGPTFKKDGSECELGVRPGENKQTEVTCIEYDLLALQQQEPK